MSVRKARRRRAHVGLRVCIRTKCDVFPLCPSPSLPRFFSLSCQRQQRQGQLHFKGRCFSSDGMPFQKRSILECVLVFLQSGAHLARHSPRLHVSSQVVLCSKQLCCIYSFIESSISKRDPIRAANDVSSGMACLILRVAARDMTRQQWTTLPVLRQNLALMAIPW
jgi:hypothetical protein